MELLDGGLGALLLGLSSTCCMYLRRRCPYRRHRLNSPQGTQNVQVPTRKTAVSAGKRGSRVTTPTGSSTTAVH